MELLGERPVWSMSGSEMLSSLDAAYAEIARLKTFALKVIAGLETTGHAKDLGAGTTARLLTFRYRIDAVEARRDVHLANALAKYPAVAAALPDPHHTPDTTADAAEAGVVEDSAVDDAASEGGVSESGAGVGVLLHPGQAEAIVSALDKVPTTVPVDDLRVAEHELVELARTHGPGDLRKAGKRIRDLLDTDGPEPDEDKAHNRESLTLKNAESGVAFRGYLANENAELFRTLIHAHAKPHKTVDGALDPRGRDKRQADALTTLLAAANNAIHSTGDRRATTDPGDSHSDNHGGGQGGGVIAGHGPKALITVTIDFNDLKAATADKIGHLIYGDALSAAAIRRLACDAQILPIVLGSDSRPLDVGTAVRLATGPIRKALIARDKGCVCCGAPPLYCDAHHVTSWIDGGETKVTNLALLCKRCHRDLHAGHWDIQITNGIVQVTRPTWATPDPVPRGRHRPATTNPGSGTATAGGSGRAWPRDTDPPWITTDDTARLNPWGDACDERPTRTTAA